MKKKQIVELSLVRQMGIRNLKPELERIKTPDVNIFVKRALEECVPERFFIIPAASSGKFHPQTSSGIGGLVRHTKSMCYILHELLPLYDKYFDDEEWDINQAAAMLHDIGKPYRNHPIMAKEILKPLKKDYPKIYRKVVKLIESHMGQWNKGDDGQEFPVPKTEAERLIHLCDYMSSKTGLPFIYNQQTSYSDLLK